MSIVHTTVEAEFYIIEGLVVSGVAITIGDIFNSFDLIDILLDSPPELTDKLKYGGPIPESVNTRKLPANALS